MSIEQDKAIAIAVARDQIRDVISRYSNGIDRCNVDNVKAVFWPDAQCDYGSFVGSAWEFAEQMVKSLLQSTKTQHVMGQMAIVVEDYGHASGETYAVAYNYMQNEQGQQIIRIVGGRYLDEFEARDGEWRILKRIFVMDWNENAISTEESEGWLYGTLNRGCRYPEDRSSRP